MSFRNCIILLLATLLSGVAKAQSINSPYSNYGLGEIAFQGLPHNFAMGEAGIAMPTLWHINLQNPSLLINNSLSSFQVGLMGDIRNYSNGVESSNGVAASLRFLAMSFPVVRNRWTSSFALLPFSSANYNTFSRDTLADGVVGTQRLIGDGGLSSLVWANGIRVYKTLSLGVKASYVFGQMSKESQLFLSGNDLVPSTLVSYVHTSAYSDFLLSLSAAYKQKIGERKFLNFGLVYDFSQELGGEQDIILRRLALSGSTIQEREITEDASVSFNLPRKVGVGASYEYLNKFKAGFDLTFKNWKEGGNNEAGVELRNTMELALGAAWSPDVQSVNNYLDRVTYRVGFNAKQSPYLVNNTEINDFGINFGASFPVSGYSSMDAAFKFGQRGSTDNLIRENYFQVVIGATINDQWFIKRRYD